MAEKSGKQDKHKQKELGRLKLSHNQELIATLCLCLSWFCSLQIGAKC